MANYATHIAAGTVVSGALATLTMAADVIGPQSLVAVTLAGVLGSVLPDIDLKDSRASSVLFSGIGVFASFCVLFLCAPHFSIVELWILWLGALVFFRYGLHAIFHRFAVHRGVWHSVLAGLFVAALTVLTFKVVLRLEDGVAWLGGAFMLIGYVVHLVLDEVYSVDFLGNRIKSSFGTALKLYDGARPATSGAMMGATVALFLLLPSPQAFIDGIGSRDLWAGINQRLLPRDKWFGGLAADSAGALDPERAVLPTSADDGAAQGIITGSIPAVGRDQ
ncbi:MAG: metal-dependent hydrolase [Hyphomicrobiaceae bacterium]|nr:metal-dependent hydrolase [Hyphomicrobiaceae bacterium]